MPNQTPDRRSARDATSPARPHPAPRSRGGVQVRVIAMGAAALAGLVLVASLVMGGGGGPGATVAPAGATIAGSPVAVVASNGSGAPGSASSHPPSESPSPESQPPADTPPPTAEPVPSASPAPTPTAIPAARLQAKLDKLRAKASVPGVSVAILWDDGRSWTGVSGLADVAADRPLTPGSGFALASISKTFTAAVVLQLVDEGRIGLDDPVAPLLPAYGLDRRITVRMLLDHTSGLPDFFFNRRIDALLQGAPGATWTPERAWSFVRKKRPVPGKTWAYSNTNYMLLGELVTAVTGRPLAKEIRTRLLDPLGLKDTWYQVAEKPRTPVTAGYRLVVRSSGAVRPVAVAPPSTVMPFRSVVTAAGGAGSIASTALDTARWMQAFAGGRLLSAATQAAMLADVTHTRALHATIPYGLGIQAVPIAGHKALGHSGRYLGFRNVVRYLPDEGVTIAVLTNQGAYDPARIATALLKIVLPKAPLPAASPSSAP